MTEDLLTVNDLKVTFHTYAGDVKALDGVQLSVKRGELLGLVGESGCGKSVTSLAIVGLLPANARIEQGQVLLESKNLLAMEKEELRISRLRDIAMVFQDPMTYLNPVLTVGSQITEIIETKPELFVEELIKNRLREIGETQRDDGMGDTAEHERNLLLNAQQSGKPLSKAEFNRLAKYYAISILKSVRLPEPEKLFSMYPFKLSGGMRQRDDRDGPGPSP